MVAWDIDPKSGFAPYYLTATFANKQLIDGVRFKFEVRYGTTVGACPLLSQALGNNPIVETSILSSGVFTATADVPSGSCTGYYAIVTDVVNNVVVSQLSTFVSNV